MTLLNTANAVRLGGQTVAAVYAGATKTWPPKPPPFTPSTLPGLAGWWKADALALADSAPVTTWPDASGLGRHLTGTATFKTNVVLSKPVVRFNGVDNALIGPSLPALTAGEALILVKIVNDPSIGTRTGLWRFSSADDTHYPYPDGSIYEAFGSDTRRNSIPHPPLNQWRRYNVRSAPGAWSAYVDGAQIYATSANNVAFGPAGIALGIARAAPYYLDGDIAEMILYDRVLTGAERAQLEGYLADKYFPAIDPSSLPGCVLALEAADVPPGPVASWPDRSPVANNLVVRTGAPVASAGFVTMTTANVLASSKPMTGGGGPRHLFARVRPRAGDGSFIGYGASGGGTLYDLWNRSNSTLIWHGFGGSNDTVTGAPPFAPNAWHLVEVAHAGTGTPVKVRVDGAGNQTVGNVTLTTAPTPMTFGVGVYQPVGDFDMSAFYFYDRVLTDVERQQVLNYLGP